VKYPDGEVDGHVFTPTQVKDVPEVTWDAESDAFYTVIMTDPDAPTRSDPKYREFRHWTVINIPGCDVSAGAHVAEYVGSGPPKGTGLHRYIFLLYKQQEGKIVKEVPIVPNTTAGGRGGWKAAAFAEEHALGVPIAACIYQAEYDDYVPILYAQFTA
jgi:phosphatidylethanolamine-binding protein